MKLGVCHLGGIQSGKRHCHYHIPTSSMRYSDSQAIPSSQLAICSYTYPLVELVGFLPCPCVLVHIVYLLHINLKKKKKGHCQSHITIFGTLSHGIPD